VKHWVPIGLMLVFVLLQFIPVERSNPPVEAEIPAPSEVRDVLRRACYDCHSNESRWPWYAHVAPVSWLIAHDVEEARDHLNFSTWEAYDEDEQRDHIDAVWEEVESGEMPLWFYLPLHPEARLSAEDLERLKSWVEFTQP
jgi:hypothetical protein